MSRAISRRQGLAGAAALALAAARQAGAAGNPVADNATPHAGPPKSGPAMAAYADPGMLERLPFGTRSHWLQPWRATSGTVPAAVLSRSLGAVLEDVTTLGGPAMVDTLARSGIRNLRFEIGWGDLDFATESRLVSEGNVRHLLLACQRANVRPLILLNANHGRPAPAQVWEVRLANPVAAGSRSVVVSSGAGVVPCRTGITNTAEGVMADAFVTGVDAGRLELSKPISTSLPAGARLKLATLRYEPFTTPGTERNEATMAGWLRYVDVVAGVAGGILDPDSGPDRGFDLEVWNELTFGSRFLSIANYYDPKPADASPHEDAIWTELATRTAAHAAGDPDRYAGVSITNGFANTIPWVASSRQHPRISAISKHPYPQVEVFPRDRQANCAALGPDSKPIGFEPSYVSYFPEYGATAIQTETLLRDLSATPNDIQGVKHGRLARVEGGRPAPVDVWLTELGVNPRVLGITDRGQSERLKAKFCLRASMFYLGIGVARVYLFNAISAPDDFGLIDANMPSAPTPALHAISRAIATIRGPADEETGQAPLRSLSFSVHPSSPDSPRIFAGGDGAPPLLGSDCLVLLPFQQASGCLAIVYYVMTRDVRVDRRPERLQVEVTGAGEVGTVKGFDPLTNQEVACRVAQPRPGRLALDLEATDSPRIVLLACGDRS
jgi:hypothetical protein